MSQMVEAAEAQMPAFTVQLATTQTSTLLHGLQH